MKVIVNFGEKKVVVPCGTVGDLSIRDLIRLATTKYCKLSAFNNISNINSDQVQLRLNNGAVVDPDDRVCDVVDDREELFASIESHSTNNSNNGELSSSLTSSNISTSLSEHERPLVPPPSATTSSNNRHEVIVTDADLRTQSLRIKADSNDIHQSNAKRNSPSNNLSDNRGMYNVTIDEKTGDKTFYISLPKENSPLGIHVIPYNSNEEQVNGLVLQNIELDGRIKRQGVLEINDRIIEINRINIESCSFEKAQLIFRNALLENELELKIVRSIKKNGSSAFYLNNNNNNHHHYHHHQNNNIQNEINHQNTKRLGKIVKITLKKGNDGLGFKLASRDNPTGIANPIYVKTIFPKGAAVEDGRLCIGDRLLTVNSVDVTQMSLQETVGLLRETRIGDTIHLCVSRQQDGSLPKDLVNDKVKTQIMTFDIPLRDTSSAGLGITLKGKTSLIEGQSTDLGIFVKSILTGGAAYRDNRLCSNDQILIINDSSLVNMTNLEAASILHDAVRKEIQPGFIKITISRVLNDDENMNSNNVKEIELLPSMIPNNNHNNDENELDLTDFVTPTHRKPPMKPTKTNDFDFRTKNNQSPMIHKTTLSETQNQQEFINENANPFERETPFRQSISEKRRVTQHGNNQISQWKQQSFHEARANSERRKPGRPPTDASFNIARSTSYESIQRSAENCEQNHSSKLRNRACNDSFRQAVDKSYCQNNNHNESSSDDKSNKIEKQKFKFSNLFTTKSKRRENQDEKSTFTSTVKSTQNHQQIVPLNNQATFFPPPPAPFSSRHDLATNESQSNERLSIGFTYSSNPQQQGYQPHRFKSNQIVHSQQIIDHFTSADHETNLIPGKSSLSINPTKSSHPPIPRQFLQSNINGSQSLKQYQPISRSPYPPTFNVQPHHFVSHNQNNNIPLNTSQQMKRTIYPPSSSRSYLQFENPANV